MSAVDTIENLLRLGMMVKDGLAASGLSLPAFFASDAFTKIEGQVEALLVDLQPDDIQSAIAAIQTKKAALLGGGAVGDLASDKLLQYFDLLTTENVLVVKQLAASRSSRTDFLTVLENDVLPVLVSVAKVVIPLLV